MATKTIGGIATSVTALAAADLIEVEQGGVTKKATLQDVADISSENRLINPNWFFSQIYEDTLVTVGPSAGVAQTLDGWSAGQGSAGGVGSIGIIRAVDPDNAALLCMKITPPTADASIAAGDLYHVMTAIEGYDVADLKSGLASAGSVTVRFKFKTSITGVYGISLANSALNRSRVEIITVPDTNENEYTVTFALDQTGTWLYTNGIGLYLRICLAAGSTYQKAAGTWDANNCYTTSAQCNFMSSNANIAYLKRIQLCSGAPPANPARDYQKELAKCQRYYWKTFPAGTMVAQNAGLTGSIAFTNMGPSASNSLNWMQHPVTMRAVPTMTSYNPSAANGNVRDISNNADRTPDVTAATVFGVGVGGQNQSANAGHRVHITANARLT